MKKKQTHGGARPGAGRTPITKGLPSVVLTARVSPEQLDKFRRLGGAAWLRQRIDRAKGPAT